MQDVNIPALGMAMTEAVLTQWHKQPGDSVAAGDVIAEIETDKSNVDLESPADGVLGAHLVGEGDAVAIGAPVVRILEPGETELDQAGTEPERPSEDAGADHATGPATDDRVVDVSASAPAEGETAEAGFYRPPAKTPHTLSPRKRRLARLEAEAEAFFTVTAEGGPTQAREAAAAAAPPVRPAGPSPRPAAPLATPPARSAGRYRAAIAERVVQSWREIPHFAVQREVDAGEADSCLAALRQRDGGATFTDLLLRAYALAMADVVETEGDVGLAVATPEGVMMPVVQAVPSLDAPGLVTRRTAAVRRGREGRLAPYDLTSTPVGSLSNLGARGVDSFTGIIPVNQRMLLTVGRVAARPVVVEGRLAVRTTLIATLNVDHRSLDGDQAALVLSAFARELGALRAWAEGEQR